MHLDTPPERAASATRQAAVQDLVTELLDRAVTVSYAITLLDRLAAGSPHGEPTAHAEITNAITAMTDVRTQPIDSADQLGARRQ